MNIPFVDLKTHATYFMVTFANIAWWIVPVVNENQNLNVVRDTFIKLYTYSNKDLWPNNSTLPAYMDDLYNNPEHNVIKPECIQAKCGLCGTDYAWYSWNVCDEDEKVGTTRGSGRGIVPLPLTVGVAEEALLVVLP